MWKTFVFDVFSISHIRQIVKTLVYNQLKICRSNEGNTGRILARLCLAADIGNIVQADRLRSCGG